MSVLIAKLASSPLVHRVLLPAMVQGLAKFLERLADRAEMRGAINAAKTAKASEEYRLASKKLHDATLRR